MGNGEKELQLSARQGRSRRVRFYTRRVTTITHSRTKVEKEKEISLFVHDWFCTEMSREFYRPVLTT